MIPYSTQDINDADVRAVSKALREPFLTQGPAVERFEKKIAAIAGTKYAVALSSGTAALHAAYAVAGLKEGDEVIVPSLTFAATANAALYVNATPVFADIDLNTGLIDVQDVEKKITNRTKAVVGVDYSGRPVAYRALRALAKKHRLIFISDAAHSFGATYNSKPVGGQADMTTFSFHPLKSITTAEGGAVVTNNKSYFEALVAFRTHGITKDPKKLTRVEGLWYHEMQLLGYNYRITDIQAVLGESQLKRLPAFIKKRRAIAARYHTLLASVPGITVPLPERAYETSAWHLYPIRVNDPERRRALFEELRARGVGVQVHYLPVYQHPFYVSLGYDPELCPSSNAFYASEISIPIYPGLTRPEQDTIVRVLKEALEKSAENS